MLAVSNISRWPRTLRFAGNGHRRVRDCKAVQVDGESGWKIRTNEKTPEAQYHLLITDSGVSLSAPETCFNTLVYVKKKKKHNPLACTQRRKGCNNTMHVFIWAHTMVIPRSTM